MATKKNFTSEEGYNDIASIVNISNTSNVSKPQAKRQYNRLDPKAEAPEDYRINLKMPGQVGRYVAARASLEFKTRTNFIVELIEADMKKHPEVLENINKKGKK